MKIGKYIPLGTYNEVKMGYGTVDFKNLKTIYLKINTWVQPENETEDFNSTIHKSRRKIKEIIYNLENSYCLPISVNCAVVTRSCNTSL